MNDLTRLVREMRTPSIAEALPRVAEQGRNEQWSYQDFLTALLEREGLARQADGGEARIRAFRFPARKPVKYFDFTHQISIRRQIVMRLSTLALIEARENVIFLGPPGSGKTHLTIAPGIKACLAGRRAHSLSG